MAYNINIDKGQGTGNIVNGNYNVEASSTGYDSTTLLPKSVEVNDTTTALNFTISATGTLTVHITEDGTSSGTSIVGAKIVRCDSSGITYGDEITTDSSGNAVFEHVPYSESDTPPTIYYKQTASDGSHNFDSALKSITLESQTKTVELENAPAKSIAFTMTDANYTGLPIETATISMN